MSKQISDERPPLASLRQWKFAIEYLRNGRNAQAAAIKAGYSADTIHAAAYRLLRSRGVAAALERIAARHEAAAGMTRMEAVELLTKLALDATNSPSDRIKAVKQLSLINGWEKTGPVVQITNQATITYHLKDLRAYDPAIDAVATADGGQQEPPRALPEPRGGAQPQADRGDGGQQP